MDDAFLSWPFFDENHRTYARAVRAWCASAVPALTDLEREDAQSVGECVTRLVQTLGGSGLLRACVPAAYGGIADTLDVRHLCLARDALAYASGLADFAFAMQGLGSTPIALFGNDAQKRRYLPGIVTGARIGAFALSEPDAGSDVAAIATTARRTAGGWRLDGTKTWISNAGIASQYVVFARTGPDEGAKGLSAFIVDASCHGLTTQPIDVMAPHPLGTLQFDDCRVDDGALIGEPGAGFRIAMTTLDAFRSTVGAAAVGFARRAFDEGARRAHERTLFGRKLADLQLTQAKLGDMATAIDASALLVYRAAWTRDVLGTRVTREASMAKLFATESAQQVIDASVQIFGGLGVVRGVAVERLYREIRALRIYEGASEVLKLVVGQRAAEAARSNLAPDAPPETH